MKTARVIPIKKKVRAPNWGVDRPTEPGKPWDGVKWRQGDVIHYQFDPPVPFEHLEEALENARWVDKWKLVRPAREDYDQEPDNGVTESE